MRRIQAVLEPAAKRARAGSLVAASSAAAVLAAAAGTAAMASGFAPAAQSPVLASPFAANVPVDITAGTLRRDPETCTVFFGDRVELVQGAVRGAADRASVVYRRDAAGKCAASMTRLVLTGSVRINGLAPASGEDEVIFDLQPAGAEAPVAARAPWAGSAVNTPAQPEAAANAEVAADGPRIVRAPRWLERPSGADLARAYPSAAAAASQSGRATIACIVEASGRLTACRTLMESPAGAGFGAAAESLAPRFRMDPQAGGGAPIAGAAVNIPILFNLGPTQARTAPQPR